MAYWMDALDRSALIAKAVSLGYDEAGANLWLDRLLESRVAAKQDKIAGRLAALDALINERTLQRSNSLIGRSFIVTNAPVGAPKTATLLSLDERIAQLVARIAQLQAARDDLVGES